MTSRQLLKCLPAMPKRLYGFGIGRSQGVVPKLELVGSRVGGLRLEAFKNRQLQDGRVPGQLRVCVHYARLCPLPPQIWLHGFGPWAGESKTTYRPTKSLSISLRLGQSITPATKSSIHCSEPSPFSWQLAPEWLHCNGGTIKAYKGVLL